MGRRGPGRSPLHAPGKDRAGGSWGASPGSETLSPGEADLAVQRRGEAWGWEAINPSPAVYPCWSRHRGHWALAQSVCWWGDRKPAYPGLTALPYVRQWLRSGQDQVRSGAPGRQCALCGVWSAKGTLPGTGGGVGGHRTCLKEGSTFLVAARQVPRPCGRNLRCLCAVRAQRGVGDGARSVGGVGGGVCAWRVAWGLASPGKEFGFCSLLWDEERGEFGISLPLSKEHSCFSVSAISRDVLVEARDPFRGSCRCPGDAM